jgi:uncharacterized protein (DUF433 family)
MILEWIASGASTSDIVAAYPQLTAGDVSAASRAVSSLHPGSPPNPRASFR